MKRLDCIMTLAAHSETMRKLILKATEEMAEGMIQGDTLPPMDIISGEIEEDILACAKTARESIEHMRENLDPEKTDVDKVIDQIKIDIEGGDVTAIEELLKFVPLTHLRGFLPEKTE